MISHLAIRKTQLFKTDNIVVSNTNMEFFKNKFNKDNLIPAIKCRYQLNTKI